MGAWRWISNSISLLLQNLLENGLFPIGFNAWAVNNFVIHAVFVSFGVSVSITIGFGFMFRRHSHKSPFVVVGVHINIHINIFVGIQCTSYLKRSTISPCSRIISEFLFDCFFNLIFINLVLGIPIVICCRVVIFNLNTPVFILVNWVVVDVAFTTCRLINTGIISFTLVRDVIIFVLFAF